MEVKFMRGPNETDAVGAIIHYALAPTHMADEHGNASIDAFVQLVNRSQGVMN